ncbi:inhibitor of carbonic anhydrase-like isoform X2 [Suncus etruscus]|uniref:inhibitor of carbonic anhydrase-like isoform X2 n=1 Tax=Suncus etruscus TaxID=109475 RepID=UPI00210F8B89|nr:inhibitor of carbonic anhydrase-like isoform X2 [Suncus etruscus]
MQPVVGALLYAGLLGLCLAAPDRTVRWCTTSDHETSKCSSWKKALPADGPLLDCVRRNSPSECIKGISNNEADAVTVEGGLVLEAGLAPYNLKPIMAEFYGSKSDPQTHHYVVALVKKGSGFQLNQLQGKKSCLPGLGWAAGWNILTKMLRPSASAEEAMAQFFASSCVPCADGKKFPNLCQLCAGQKMDKCACSSQEPYFGYRGAFKCLQDGAGDVSFVRHLTVFENVPEKADRDQYELLCRDNTRKPVDEYKDCHLGRIPSHAVVARSVGGKDDLIRELLNYAQEHFGKGKSTEFQLFASSHGKDLLVSDAAQGFLQVPPKMDAKLYMGYEYISTNQHLRGGAEHPQRVLWCAVGTHEKAKCDNWSAVSGGILQCSREDTTEDCMATIVKGEADAMTLDGSHIYVAGECGLVPVLAEIYKPKDGTEQLGSKCTDAPIEGYYVVAVVKKDSDFNWNSLRGKKSCLPAAGMSVGWTIPMGLMYNQTGSCQFDQIFSQSCAPGSDPHSSFCVLCSGSSEASHKCAPNSHEPYYSSSGAFRCLVEKGDVAFVKHSAILQNTGGRNTETWAKNLKQEDFRLLCLDGTRKPVTEPQNCHLAIVPNYAVVSRKDKADFVHRMLFNQQELFGRNGFEYMMFQMFKSSAGKDLLFSDDTECLANLKNKTTYQKYLGPEFLTTLAYLRPCLTSELLDACTFHRN